jgi:hypothetical protein
MKLTATSAPKEVRPCAMMLAGRTLHARAVWLTIQKSACCYSGVSRSLRETRETCAESGTGQAV